MHAHSEFVALHFGLFGGFAVPRSLCAACGHPILAAYRFIRVSSNNGRQGITLEFPLCEACANRLAEVESLEGRRAGRGCLASLPLALVGYYVFHALLGRVEISWLALSLVWLAAFVLIYSLFGRALVPAGMKEDAEQAANRIRSAVRVAKFEAAHAGQDGSVTLEFNDPTYAHAFQAANAARAL